MESRVSIPVTLPRTNPTISYWQDPPADIANLRSTTELPRNADIVIVGSGISGAAIAYQTLMRAPRTKIVMLEARQTCSGATGRNGGHTKAASYRTFVGNVNAVGLEEAIKMARLEYNNIIATHEFASENKIPCDNRLCNTADVIYDRDRWAEAMQAIELMRKTMPNDPTSKYEVWDSKQTKEKFHCDGAMGTVSYLAGSLSAYQFVIGVLRICLRNGLNLQTTTPAKKIQKATDDGSWIIETDRGLITCSKVVMATNGYTAALHPSLQGVIVPLRGQITAHRPGSNMPKGGLSNTYSFIHANGYEYMIPRPPGSKFAGDIVIGGGLVKAPEEGLYQYGNTDDTVLDPAISKYLYQTTETYFGQNWGSDDPAGRIRKEWTGIMGFSADGYPLVGEMPGQPGLFISASFQGHGMVLCFQCAKALTDIMLGEEQSISSWFPKTFHVSRDRLAKRFSKKLHEEPVYGQINHKTSAVSKL